MSVIRSAVACALVISSTVQVSGMSGRHPDFDVHALYQALDSARQARGLSWTQVAREISGLYADTPAGPISPSTLSGLRSRHEIEGDGVLQVLRWLHRTPESFVPGSTQMGLDAELPPVGAHRILRFDAKSIYGALDARRVERALTWNQVAKEIGGVTPAGLTRLAGGGRVSFPTVMRITGWLGRPAAHFTHVVPR